MFYSLAIDPSTRPRMRALTEPTHLGFGADGSDGGAPEAAAADGAAAERGDTEEDAKTNKVGVTTKVDAGDAASTGSDAAAVKHVATAGNAEENVVDAGVGASEACVEV